MKINKKEDSEKFKSYIIEIKVESRIEENFLEYLAWLNTSIPGIMKKKASNHCTFNHLKNRTLGLCKDFQKQLSNSIRDKIE